MLRPAQSAGGCGQHAGGVLVKHELLVGCCYWETLRQPGFHPEDVLLAPAEATAHSCGQGLQLKLLGSLSRAKMAANTRSYTHTHNTYTPQTQHTPLSLYPSCWETLFRVGTLYAREHHTLPKSTASSSTEHMATLCGTVPKSAVPQTWPIGAPPPRAKSASPSAWGPQIAR